MDDRELAGLLYDIQDKCNKILKTIEYDISMEELKEENNATNESKSKTKLKED